MQVKGTKKAYPYRWIMLILITVPFWAVNSSQYQLSAWSQDFMTDLSIGIAQFSAVMFSFAITNAVLAAFGGALEDRYGAKLVVVISGIVSTACAFGRMHTNNYYLFLILSMLIGSFAGTVAAAMPKVINAWFPQKEATFAFSVSCCGGGMGIAFAQMTSGFFAGYREALTFSAYFLLAITILWIILGKNSPDGTEKSEHQSVFRYLKEAGKIKQIWMLSLCAAGFAAYLGVASGLMPAVLPSLKGMAPEAANTAVGLLNLCSIPGAFIIPLIQRRLGTFKPLIFTLLAIVILATLGITFAPAPFMHLLFALAGFFFGVTLSFFMGMAPLQKGMKEECLGSANGIISLVQHICGTFLMANIISSRVVEANSTSIYLLCLIPLVMMFVITLFLPEVGRKEKSF